MHHCLRLSCCFYILHYITEITLITLIFLFLYVFVSLPLPAMPPISCSNGLLVFAYNYAA
nr:MAG TPA: hypothetical protein [Caudoviricetes sp.]